MTRRFHKHKIILDENFYSRNKLPKLNQDFDIKHIKQDLNKAGLEDTAVYRLAVKLSKKLTAFFHKSSKKSLLGKLTILTGKSEL